MCKSAVHGEDAARDADQAALEPMALDITRVRCPGCRSLGAMSPHGSYGRNFVYRADGRTITKTIAIVRLKCSSCKATHAVLPLAAVPFYAYSICFIAALLADWTGGVYPSIEALSDAYGISPKTFRRLKKRFAAGVSLVLGCLNLSGNMRAYALKIVQAKSDGLATLLARFTALTGRSLCERVPP